PLKWAAVLAHDHRPFSIRNLCHSSGDKRPGSQINPLRLSALGYGQPVSGPHVEGEPALPAPALKNNLVISWDFVRQQIHPFADHLGLPKPKFELASLGKRHSSLPDRERIIDKALCQLRSHRPSAGNLGVEDWISGQV